MDLRFSLLTVTTLLFLLALSQSAPAPRPANPINVTQVLDNGKQYTILLRLLNQTQVLIQLENQLNNGNQGMTLLAPNDNAFHDLPLGTLNKLNNEQKVKLVLCHVLAKYYSVKDLDVVPNPVPTQAEGIQGVLGLYFNSGANQINVSSGVVETRIMKPLRQTFPLAIYPVDKVLLPVGFIIVGPVPKGSSKTTPARKLAKAPSSPVEAPAPKGFSTTERKGKVAVHLASASPAQAPTPEGKPAKAPSSLPAQDGSSQSKNGSGRRMDLRVCVLGSVVMFCMAFLYIR
ncbi:fasciclin-like arabinogalactan protein 13 [Tanacetum coccineum]